MSFRNAVRIQKLQNKNKMMSLGTLKTNERRVKPWLGRAFCDPFYTGEERSSEELIKGIKDYTRKYDLETAEMLKKNPNLKLIY